VQAVVITGLAQGIGREVARRLARSKVPVAGFDIDADGVESLKKEFEAAGCDHVLTTLDITDRPGIVKFRDAVLAKFGRVDAVVSNVCIDCFGPFEELDLDKALKLLEINVIGAAAIFQAFLPSMRENRSGKLSLFRPCWGATVPLRLCLLASNRHRGLAASLRLEVEPFGIKVALIEPAQVSSSFAAGREPPAEGSPSGSIVHRERQGPGERGLHPRPSGHGHREGHHLQEPQLLQRDRPQGPGVHVAQ
jgi:short-subunit dehydrogenase